jgi:hypothetical protein
MKTIEEIKNLNEFEAARCDEDVHVLWTEICGGKTRLIADENQWVSRLMSSMERGASDIIRELVERNRLERTGVAYSAEGNLPDNSALATLGDWLKAWSAGDDSITIAPAC